VFFGTPWLSVIVLEELNAQNYLPSLIVTAPDKPVGRGLKLTPSPVKEWAHEHNIPTIEPSTFSDEIAMRLREESADVFVLVAYGKILPSNIIGIPPNGILNVHPSLLPKLRGPSPVRTAILNDEKTTGVSVMLIDKKMDHGPLLIQESYTPEKWPPQAKELEEHLFARGGAILADILPRYIAGDITPQEQNHDEATYCHLFKKEDGLLTLSDNPYTNLLKIHAYAGWPGTYFFTYDGRRIKVLSAHIESDELMIDEVIPEGGHTISYSELQKSQ